MTHPAENDRPEEFDEVQCVAYVGDSDAVQITCMHGDYSRFVKGATVEQGRKQLAAHYAAKHVTPPGQETAPCPKCGGGETWVSYEDPTANYCGGCRSYFRPIQPGSSAAD